MIRAVGVESVTFLIDLLHGLGDEPLLGTPAIDAQPKRISVAAFGESVGVQRSGLVELQTRRPTDNRRTVDLEQAKNGPLVPAVNQLRESSNLDASHHERQRSTIGASGRSTRR